MHDEVSAALQGVMAQLLGLMPVPQPDSAASCLCDCLVLGEQWELPRVILAMAFPGTPPQQPLCPWVPLHAGQGEVCVCVSV